MKITIDMLTSLCACQEQKDIFETVFPNGAEVDMGTLAIAQSVGLDIEWFILRYLYNSTWNLPEFEQMYVNYYRRIADIDAIKDEGQRDYRTCWLFIQLMKDIDTVIDCNAPFDTTFLLNSGFVETDTEYRLTFNTGYILVTSNIVFIGKDDIYVIAPNCKTKKDILNLIHMLGG